MISSPGTAGIAAIADRIAQLNQLFAPAATGTTATGGTTASGDAFAAALAQASGSSTDDVAWSSVTRISGGKVPASLAAYGNGKIPETALEEVGTTGHRLWGPAAEQLTALIAAAKADGVDIGITDSYRSYAAQVDVAQRKGLYSQGGLAAVPGTSDHGWGMAVDLDLDSSAQAWMQAHAADYDFVDSTPRESWHWSYEP